MVDSFGYELERQDPRDWSPHAQAPVEPPLSETPLSEMTRHDLVRELLAARFQRDRLHHAMREIAMYADGPSYSIACDALREADR